MQQGKSSQEIMDLLHIPLRSYRRYTKSIFLQDKEIWYNAVKDEVCTELLNLRNSLEDTYVAALALSKIAGLDTTEVLAALRAKDDSRLSIVQLICEGTELLSNMQQQQQPKYHKVAQSKLAMQPHP